MRSEFVDTCLGSIHIQLGGDPAGRPVMCWPSLLMTGDMWAAQAAHFADRRVVLVDPPGHGRSEKLTAGFTFDQCARVITEILDVLDIDRTDFVGNSWGGMIGGTFAASYPDRIGHAVLMNCTGSAAGWPQRVEYGALLALARLLGRIRPPLTRSVLDAFLGPTTIQTRPEVATQVRATVEAVDISSAAHAVRSVVPQRPDQHALLGRIRTPVLVIAGAEDATFPVPETAAMARAIPGSRFVVADGVAHLAALENPSLVNALIGDFIPDA